MTPTTPSRAAPPEDGIFLGTDPHDASLQFFAPESWRVTGQYVPGSSGSGKTYAMTDWALQDIIAGRGVGVIDPKGDMTDAIIAYLAAIDERYWPALAERITLIDPSDPATTPGINPLEPRYGAAPGRQRQEVHGVLSSLWQLSSSTAPRLDLVLRRTLHLLMDAGKTLADMQRLLADETYRSSLLSVASDGELRDFWTRLYPRGDASSQWSLSLLTRIGSLLDDPAVRQMFSSPRSDVDFADLMNRGGVLLVSLSRGKLGDSSAAMLGGLFTVMLQLAAESRQHIWPPERRRRWRLYADEFSGFMAASSLSELFAQGRGYGIALCVANQSLSQLDDDLKASIWANCRVRTAFRLNFQDAREVASELMHFEGNREKTKRLEFIKIGKVPVPIGFSRTYKSAAEEVRENREALHGLRDREFFVHFAERGIVGKLRTFEMPRPDRGANDGRVERFRAILSSPHPRLNDRTPPLIHSPSALSRYDWRPPSGRS